MRPCTLAILAALCAVPAAAVGQTAAAQSSTGEHDRRDPSLDRIRAALAQPSVLHIEVPAGEQPTFRVAVQGHGYYTDKPMTWDFDGGGVPFTAPAAGPIGLAPPLIKVDALPAIRSAIRSRRQRAAEAQVRHALAEFCAEHDCDL
jgi:hypothetical protein